jgi:hypothetical protein
VSPRNSSGTYTPTAGVPVTPSTTISTTMFNGLVDDLSATLTDSASRSGKGGFSAPVRTADGTVAAPAHAFTSETGSGLYKAAAGDVRLAVGGVDALKLIPGGINGPLVFPSGTTAIQVTLANGYLQLQGNLSAANATFAEVVVNSTVARTAGNLLDVQNKDVDKLFVDYQGLLRLASQAAAIQPSSIWTAITPNANWAAIGGLAYAKDAVGFVHLKGSATFNTGAGSALTTMPAGFRPAAGRTFLGQDTTPVTATPVTVSVDPTTGVLSIGGVTLTNGHTYSLDGVVYAAEQ